MHQYFHFILLERWNARMSYATPVFAARAHHHGNGLIFCLCGRRGKGREGKVVHWRDEPSVVFEGSVFLSQVVLTRKAGLLSMQFIQGPI